MPRYKDTMTMGPMVSDTTPTLLQIVRAKRSEMARAALSRHTQDDSDRRAKKSFAANRFLCAGWSASSGRRCELFAREGSDYCRYHDNDPPR